MRHLDLFSGIGGFAYAAREAWGIEYECAAFVERDWFCQQVLTKNFPEAPIVADIRDVANADGSRFQGGDQEGRFNPGHVDLVTGGFPCQPFSQAGKRTGTNDDRYLWPEMFRVIRESRPTWVIAENVGGLVTWNDGMVLEQVCADLESEGFEVQPFIIPAAAVGAPHRRDRVWFVAYSEDNRQRGLGLERQPDSKATESSSAGRNDADAEGKQTGVSRQPRKVDSSDDANPQGIGRSAGSTVRQGARARRGRQRFDPRSWGADWREVATATCTPRMDDGLPARLVRLPDGTTISEARWRRETIKAYGNAIVPQVALRILRIMRELES